ncbi:MAG: type IV secretory system conjugative DNA transfer family protein [Clostridia bacterium]|nr:type IV secretory system conjugative DNA transfer family protein [Clostridia bacterium]
MGIESILWKIIQMMIKPAKIVIQWLYKKHKQWILGEEGCNAPVSRFLRDKPFILMITFAAFWISMLFTPALFAIILIPAVYGGFAIHRSRYKGSAEPLPSEFTACEFAEPRGVVFGKVGENYFAKPETMDGHVMVIGGAGSGKSSCIAIPTLRVWKDRVFAIDIKGELYKNTSSFRANIKVMNPLDESTYGYDPYYLLKRSKNKAQEARAIAIAVIPKPEHTNDPFWVESAQNILTAAILHCSYEDLTFAETIKFVQKSSPAGLIESLVNSDYADVSLFVNSYIGIADKTLASIIAELSRNILVFATDHTLVSCLSRSKNITPADLERGADVYVQIPEHRLDQWENFLGLIVNQFLSYFEQRNEETAKPILFMLDEFPRLGKIPKILSGLATLRSKKITLCLILQSLAQLDSMYGNDKRKIISDTCAYKAILRATDAETQEYFSKLVGTYDKQVVSKGEQRAAFTGIGTGTSTNQSEQERRIIKPEEFGTLKNIVLLSPFGHCRVEKVPYFAEESKSSSFSYIQSKTWG